MSQNETPDLDKLERIINEAHKPVPLEIDGYLPVVALAEGLCLYDLDDHLEYPRRIRRNVTATDIPTLERYWDKWGTAESEIYADLEATELLVVIDEHETDYQLGQGEEQAAGATYKPQARHSDHRARYQCPMGKEWEKWCDSDASPFTQEEFGIFLEDRAQEVMDPDSSDLIAITQHFSIKQDVQYTKAIRNLDGNVALAYAETNEPEGEIKIPEIFTLAIAPFHGGKVYELKARFRYRLNSGQLRMWYELIEPWHVVEHAFGEVVSAFEEHTSRDVSMIKLGTL